MPLKGLLLPVNTPTASSRDLNQLRSLGLMSKARQSKFAGIGHRSSSPESSLVHETSRVLESDSSQVRGTSSPSVFPSGRVDSTSAAASSTLHAARSYKRRTPSTAAHDTSRPWAVQAPRMVAAGCRTQVAEQVQYFQSYIEDKDYKSLMKSDVIYDRFQGAECTQCELWYTVELVLDSDGLKVTPTQGREYKLAVDTGACGFWFYEKDFQQLEFARVPPAEMTDGVTRKWITKDWSDIPLHLQQRRRTHLTFLPSLAPIAELNMIHYGDGGALRVKRWPSRPDVDLYFRPPVWHWMIGTSLHSPDYKLQFARVLAEAVNLTTAVQGIDGNLGLGVPGWRQPWLLAGNRDRATLFDILNHEPGVVPKPLCATLRLLPPDEHQLAYANDRVQSFLYFGVGTPCGFRLPGADKILIPDYTPQLYIFPQMDDLNVFRFWSLQLLSITLLEPMIDCPDYEMDDPFQWTPKTIPLGVFDEQGPSGIRVIFDSGSTCSVLPRETLQAMWTQWFYNDPQFYPEQASFMRHTRDFSRHDVLFRFNDCSETVVTLRCSAQEFLSSPWLPEDGYPGTFACFAEPNRNTANGPNGLYILGANFFWTSIVRLDATHRGNRPVPGQAFPYMQFAPQRVLCAGMKLAGPWQLEIHPDLPPDMQAVLREQPELRV